jgi:hypothetical protein
MRWFKQHLNWTLIIGSGLLGVLLILLILIGVWANSEVVSLIIGLPNIIIVVSWGIICGWVLNNKNRSLAWLLLIVIPPLGLVGLVLLKNHTLRANN